MSTGDGIPINKTRTDKDCLDTETAQVTVQIFVRQARFPFSAWTRLPQSSLSPTWQRALPVSVPSQSWLGGASGSHTRSRYAFPRPHVWRSLAPRKSHSKLRHNPPPIIPQSHASSEALAQRPFLRCRVLYVCDVFHSVTQAAARWHPRSHRSMLST